MPTDHADHPAARLLEAHRHGTARTPTVPEMRHGATWLGKVVRLRGVKSHGRFLVTQAMFFHDVWDHPYYVLVALDGAVAGSHPTHVPEGDLLWADDKQIAFSGPYADSLRQTAREDLSKQSEISQDHAHKFGLAVASVTV